MKIKRMFKVAYYKALCDLLGSKDKDSNVVKRFYQLVPGKEAVHVFITGKVTGVGYRKWLRRESKKRKVDCWVRNKDRNTVEAVLIGQGRKLDALVDAANMGPKRAQVDTVRPKWFRKSSEGLVGKAAADSNGDLKDVLLGKIGLSKIDFNDENVLRNHIVQLDELHQHIDERFKSFYDKLFRSKPLKTRRAESRQLYERLAAIVKKDYISHYTLRKFERSKVNILKTISFRDIMVENSTIRRLGCPEYAWKLDKKNIAYRFADEIGLRRPASDSKVYKLSDVEPQSGPIVLKPVKATGAMGVYLIFAKDRIYSARDGIWMRCWAEVIDDAASKLDKRAQGKNSLMTKDEWMLEELIVDPDNPKVPASDLKFYCFYGEVLLIQEVNRERHYGKVCFWDQDLIAVKTGRYDDKLFQGSGCLPEHMETVKKISLQVPAPFIRIDMLKGKELVLGEFTPRPGKFDAFNDEWDRKFGVAYRKAEARIKSDLLNGKGFDAFKKTFRV
ncbi:MAG: hypothetical protein FH749_07515 [Firmicutes bacterium]|nr:hypothetical protein [Bacillota bacterium]